MNRSKAELPFGSETLLQRVVRRLSLAVPRIIIAAEAAADPASPPERLPADPPFGWPNASAPVPVQWVRDAQPDRGPLEGLAAAFSMLPADAVAFVTACDAPFLQPEFVQRLLDLLDEGHDAVAPRIDGQLIPLPAVYRASLLPQIRRLQQHENAGPRRLLESASVRYLAPAAWRDIDPHDRSLVNINDPAAYQAALDLAGLPPAGSPHD